MIQNKQLAKVFWTPPIHQVESCWLLEASSIVIELAPAVRYLSKLFLESTKDAILASETSFE